MMSYEIRSLIRIYEAGGELVIIDEDLSLPGPPHTGVWNSGPWGTEDAIIKLTPAGTMLAKAHKDRRRLLVKLLRSRSQILYDKFANALKQGEGDEYDNHCARYLRSSVWFHRTAVMIEAQN